MPSPTQVHRDLRLSTALGQDVLAIERISGSESLCRPFEFRVLAVAAKDSFKFDDLVGTSATVSYDIGANGTRQFNGLVSQVQHSGYDLSGLSRYELVLVPWIWFLSAARIARSSRTNRSSRSSRRSSPTPASTPSNSKPKAPTIPASIACNTARPTSTSSIA